MILRIAKMAIDLPKPNNPSPNAAAAIQELLGGKFGEMSTLMNYTFQSFNSIGEIWNGPHPEDGSDLRVENAIPAGFAPPNLPEEPQLTAPGVDPEFIKEVAKRISR